MDVREEILVRHEHRSKKFDFNRRGIFQVSMALRQGLLNFRCGASGVLRDETVWREVLARVRPFLGSGTVTESDNQLANGRLSVLVNSSLGCHATVRSECNQDNSTLLVDVVFPSPADHQETLKKLGKDVGQILKCSQFQRALFPVVRHGEGGASDGAYKPSVDGRLTEYDFTDLVFEKDSDYQNVKVFTSGQYGNVLVLDDDVNLAESDIAYTKAITGDGVESYRGKRVLVLGGGDGGILNHLLTQEPAYVEMIDIDQVVIDAAVKHLRGICGTSMDSMAGSNYKIRVEDCIPAMEDHISNGVKFDFVINDLTAIPISQTPIDSFWDFMRQILDLSFRVLEQDGVYYTQGNSVCAKSALAMYEGELAKLSPAVQFTTHTVCVPSYQELILYRAW